MFRHLAGQAVAPKNSGTRNYMPIELPARDTMADSASAIGREVQANASHSSVPWSPWTAFAHVFLLGPLAGVLVAHFNLKRMGLAAQARTLLWRGVIGSALYAMLIVHLKSPAPLVPGLVVSLAAGRYLYSLQEPACSRWKSEHPGAAFRTGWSSVGWGLVGAAALLVVSFLSALAAE